MTEEWAFPECKFRTWGRISIDRGEMGYIYTNSKYNWPEDTVFENRPENNR
jgi:hypothetical protein